MTEMIQIPGKDYSIGQTTVTQGQWKSVMGTEPWKGEVYVREGYDYPAVCISWEDATAFCEKLSAMEGKTYRLPTEAEWEYACRGGASTNYHFGDDATELVKYGWFNKNALFVNEPYAHRVALKWQNQFGLYDMHGNVWEWCSDWSSESRKYRVLRGGSWNVISVFCSAWYRDFITPENRYYYIGFRLAIST